MGDLPEKHDLVIFIIRFKPQCLGNIRFFGIALVIFEKCEKCDRTAYQKAKEKCDNRILSGLMYWLIVAIVMGILFIITGLLIVGIGYQVGKIYRKYCWDIISIVEVITSTAIAIYFGDWIKSVISINLITLLLLVHVVYIGIRCYVKDWMEERGYC